MVYKDFRENKTLSDFGDKRFIPEMSLIQKLKTNRLCCLSKYFRIRRINHYEQNKSILETFLEKWNEESKKLDLDFISHCNYCRENGAELFWLKEEYIK